MRKELSYWIYIRTNVQCKHRTNKNELTAALCQVSPMAWKNFSAVVAKTLTPWFLDALKEKF